MAHVSTLTRLRTGDIRSIPIGVWPLLGLAVADVVLRLQAGGLSSDLADIPSLFILAAPFLFAAAVVYAAPADRRFVLGALAIAVPELFTILEILLTSWSPNLIQDFDWFRLRLNVIWPFTLGGLLLIGLALGGIKTRLGWGAVAAGAALFVIGDAWYAFQLAANPLPEGLPIEYLPVSFLTSLVIVGWAYLLGAALERGLRALTIGAALTLGLNALGIVIDIVIRAFVTGPGSDLGLLVIFTTIANLALWFALIVGALTELHPVSRSERDPQD